MSTRSRSRPWFREPGERYETALKACDSGLIHAKDTYTSVIITAAELCDPVMTTERAILKRMAGPERMLADMFGLRNPKRRYRHLGVNQPRRLVVIPKRIRLGIEQKPHPHIGWARKRAEREAWLARMRAAGRDPNDTIDILADAFENLKPRHACFSDMVGPDNALLRLLNRKG